MAAADAGRVCSLAISMKVFIKSWKSIGAGGPRTGAGTPGAGVPKADVLRAGEPAPLGAALSFFGAVGLLGADSSSGLLETADRYWRFLR